VNSLRVLADPRDVVVTNFSTRTGRNLQNDLVQRVRPKNVDVIAGVGAASGQCDFWPMR
jgi:hypothetical protein